MDPFKVFIEFITVLLLFVCFNILAFLALILAPQPGIIPTPLALEGEVLTTGPPGNSPKDAFLHPTHRAAFIYQMLVSSLPTPPAWETEAGFKGQGQDHNATNSGPQVSLLTV